MYLLQKNLAFDAPGTGRAARCQSLSLFLTARRPWTGDAPRQPTRLVPKPKPGCYALYMAMQKMYQISLLWTVMRRIGGRTHNSLCSARDPRRISAIGCIETSLLTLLLRITPRRVPSRQDRCYLCQASCNPMKIIKCGASVSAGATAGLGPLSENTC